MTLSKLAETFSPPIRTASHPAPCGPTATTWASWRSRLQTEDLRALTPLFYLHVHPYGRFDLDMSQRLVIELQEAA
jgi:hypothetical protein